MTYYCVMLCTGCSNARRSAWSGPPEQKRVCIYIYIYIYICIHIYRDAYVCIYVYIYIHTYIHAIFYKADIRIERETDNVESTYREIYIMNQHISIHVYIYIYTMWVCIYIYIYIYLYV